MSCKHDYRYAKIIDMHLTCRECEKEISQEDYEELQQARKEGKAEGIRLGWEQAKAEAAAKADELFKYESGYYHYREDVGDAIASMEYKEAQDES